MATWRQLGEETGFMKISHIALGVALGLGVVGSGMIADPAFAQRGKKQEAAPAGPKASKIFMPVAQQIQVATQANDFAGAMAKVKEAEALPGLTPDDQYILANFKRFAAARTQDWAALEQATNTMLASGRLSVAEQAQSVKILAQLAAQKNDNNGAVQQYQRLVQLTPDDAEAHYNIAAISYRARNLPAVVPAINKAIEVTKAQGKPVPAAWYGLALQAAYDGKVTGAVIPAALAFVQAYPTRENWRDALDIYRRTAAGGDKDLELDIYRLALSVNAMQGEADYIDYADTAIKRGLPGEAKFVIDSGVASKMIVPSKPVVKELLGVANAQIGADRAGLAAGEAAAKKATAGKAAVDAGDAYFSYQNYAKAAEMYRLALTKGSIDTNVVNSRLGMALARSGDKAGAQTALAAVTGPRQGLAQFWIANLNPAPAPVPAA
jgi:Flp pilus assembly protein TadD